MSDASEMNKVLLVIIAFFIPPLAVGLKRGIGTSLLINIILTILFWLPGFIHALIVILN
ncbi:MAG TPA: YqaE/Pmp3 family membrane protein [Phycisphaerales bacterium]|nr:YqaE/Pmp3 family membrane protein [Phycisphaerales bacterium]